MGEPIGTERQISSTMTTSSCLSGKRLKAKMFAVAERWAKPVHLRIIAQTCGTLGWRTGFHEPESPVKSVPSIGAAMADL